MNAILQTLCGCTREVEITAGIRYEIAIAALGRTRTFKYVGKLRGKRLYREQPGAQPMWIMLQMLENLVKDKSDMMKLMGRKSYIAYVEKLRRQIQEEAGS